MKQLVLTLIGKDKAGLVEQLATIVSEHHGNWTASNLSHLAGFFAGILALILVTLLSYLFKTKDDTNNVILNDEPSTTAV